MGSTLRKRFSTLWGKRIFSQLSNAEWSCQAVCLSEIASVDSHWCTFLLALSELREILRRGWTFLSPVCKGGFASAASLALNPQFSVRSREQRSPETLDLLALLALLTGHLPSRGCRPANRTAKSVRTKLAALSGLFHKTQLSMFVLSWDKSSCACRSADSFSAEKSLLVVCCFTCLLSDI